MALEIPPVPESIWMQSSRLAFQAWCEQQSLAVDYDAPHGQAFVAGYEAGGEAEFAATQRANERAAKAEEQAAVYERSRDHDCL